MWKNEHAEILHVSSTRWRDPYAEGYKHLAWGHHPADCRCTGGDFFYKGDEAEARKLLKQLLAEQERGANKYYSQKWI